MCVCVRLAQSCSSVVMDAMVTLGLQYPEGMLPQQWARTPLFTLLARRRMLSMSSHTSGAGHCAHFFYRAPFVSSSNKFGVHMIRCIRTKKSGSVSGLSCSDSPRRYQEVC